eukprot:10266-Heterococcus_DN1.PRE.1
MAVLSMYGAYYCRSAQKLASIVVGLQERIENPCVVLDQENSKTFLKGSPHDKYKFFLRATVVITLLLLNQAPRKLHLVIEQCTVAYPPYTACPLVSTNTFRIRAQYLAKLKENIAQIRADAEKWLNMCQREQSRLPQLEAAVNDLTVEFAKFRELDNQRAKISKLQIQLFWAKFEEAEKLLEGAKAEVKKAQKKCENVVKKQGELETEIDEKTAEKESIKAEQEEHLEAATTMKERAVAATEALTDARKPLAALLATQRKHQLALRELTGDKDKVVKKIKTEREASLRDADGQEERNLILKSEKLTNQISECDTTAEAARVKVTEIEQQLKAAKEQGMAAQAAFRVRTSLFHYTKALCARERDQLRALESNSGGNSNHPLSIYGGPIISLVQKIQQNAQLFRVLPIGPVGSYIKMKEHYRTALDCCIIILHIINYKAQTIVNRFLLACTYYMRTHTNTCAQHCCSLHQGYEQYQLCVEEHIRGLVRTFIVSCVEDKNELIKLMASHPETRKLTIIMGKQSAAPHSIPQYSDVLQMSSV